MGFRGSRVQIPPSRLSEDQALQRLSRWGFFFDCTPCCEFCCESCPLQRLTIRCVGCNTTCRTVSASGCWYERNSVSSFFQPPASITSRTGYPFRSVAHFRRIECHNPCGGGASSAN